MKKCFTRKNKLAKVMKICVIQAIICITLCSLAVAHSNYAQVLDKKVTLSLREVSIEEALDAIEKAADVKFFYSVDQLDIRDKISFEAIDRFLRDLLDELLTPYRVKYKVHERKSTITLKKENNGIKSDERVGDSEVLGPAARYPAETITGKVTNAANHQPMAGVNVIIKGTTGGTTTDSDGNFSILADDKDILVFSFIGFTTFETQVSGRTTIHVDLVEDIRSLKEVVINAGYWQVNEKEQTGNIARVTSKEISNQPISNPLQALQGRMAGVYIQQTTGVPGGGYKIQIRGQNSLRKTDADNGNYPLYIIDGVPFTPTSLAHATISSPIGNGNAMSSINPADIESIEILKDADATAIYGSRGANGVVLITTKKGKAGKTTLDVNISTGVGEVTNTLDLLNTRQYLDMRYEAFKNDNIELTPATLNAYDLTAWDTTRYTNWQKELIGGTANLINGRVSLSGGNESTQFLFSGGYYDETTVFPGDFGYMKGSGHFSLSHSSNDKKFTAVFSTQYVAEENNLVREDFTRASLVLPPNAPPVFNETGELNWENGTWINPIASTLSVYKNKTDNLISNAQISYALSPAFQLKTSAGYNYMTLRQFSTVPIKSNAPGSGIVTGTSLFSNGYIKTWIIEPQLDYKKRIGEATLTALIGATFQQNLSERSTVNAGGFISDALLEDIRSAAQVQITSSDYSLYRYNAIFGRINYNWRGKYLVNLTGRRDGSSRFGPGKQFANFGAIGTAWIFSNEKFIERNLPFLSFGKLRGSYGTTGSDQIGNYGYLDASSTTRYPYQGAPGLVPSRLANPEYAWETNKKIEAALDLGFFKDRVLISASWYKNRSGNQLIGLPLPGTTGFSSIQFNLPATVQNTGWELILNFGAVQTNEVTWNTSLNCTFPQSKLIEYSDIQNSPYATVYSVGKPLNVIYAYHYTGVDPQTGLYTFKDLDGNGLLSSSADRQFEKTIGENFYGGFQNTVTYKGFEIDFIFQFVKQQGRNYLYGNFNVPGAFGNQPVIVMDRWQEPGEVANVQRFTRGSGPASAAYSNTVAYGDNTLADASFIRLKNISISWQFPENFLKKVSLRQLQLYFQGQNLFTFTKYDGLDPENQSTSSLPPLKMITVGLQLTL